MLLQAPCQSTSHSTSKASCPASVCPIVLQFQSPSLLGSTMNPPLLMSTLLLLPSHSLKSSVKLTYAAMGMCPDISAAVCSLSPFSASFSWMHIDAMKHILRYLRGTLDHGILYTMGGGELVGYTDRDWANNTTNWHSISGFTFLYAGGAVSWMSKQQSTIATLSTHAKYISAAKAAKELVWLCHLLSEVGESVCKDRFPSSGPCVDVGHPCAVAVNRS